MKKEKKKKTMTNDNNCERKKNKEKNLKGLTNISEINVGIYYASVCQTQQQRQRQ